MCRLTHRANAENPNSNESEVVLLAFPFKFVATNHLTVGCGFPLAWQRTWAPVWSKNRKSGGKSGVIRGGDRWEKSTGAEKDRFRRSRVTPSKIRSDIIWVFFRELGFIQTLSSSPNSKSRLWIWLYGRSADIEKIRFHSAGAELASISLFLIWIQSLIKSKSSEI